MKKYISIRLVLSLLIGSAYFQSVLAQSPAIEGYSPVSYFTKHVAERGSPDFQVKHEGKIYYVSSLEQLTLFNENPDMYAPKFGDYCPYSLILGRELPIDPTSFKVIGNSLLLFHKSEQLDARTEWNKGKDEDQLEEATGVFVLLSF